MRGIAKREVHKKRRWPVILMIAMAVLMVSAAALFFVFQYRAGKYIAKDVSVNGFSVGGMTAEEAADALQGAWPLSKLEQPISLSYNGETLELELTATMQVDYLQTAHRALERGRQGERNIPLAVEAKGTALELQLLEFARNCEQSYNMFAFNEAFTCVQIQTKDIPQLMDSDATIQQIVAQVAENCFDRVNAVTIDTSHEHFPHQLYLRLERPAKDAIVEKDADGKEFITAHVIGIHADEADLIRHLEQHETAFELSVTPIIPNVLIEDLDIAFYQDVLGEQRSYYDLNLVNRSKNVTLAAKLIDGYEIMPGKTFSYNGVVGERTYARGFRTAIVYTGEGTEEGLGGGICQVSSTLYSAQLKADLETVERVNHSYTVVYVPLGQDATVVYGALDYRFKNNTNYPVKISAVASGGVLTVRLLGTKLDSSTTIELAHERISTLPYNEQTVEDDTLPAGEQQIKQKGQPGAVINTYKIYKKEGVVTNRRFVHRSTYKPMNQIVLLGTGQTTDDVPLAPPAAEQPQTPDTPTVPQPSTSREEPAVSDQASPEVPAKPETPIAPSETEQKPESIYSENGL